ncbi:hypothetical protein FB471_5261 [Amycolatopsis cihanbeyliensis]|uniref:Uncharacterized protein n=2 Tax=Amycolatopsis cihanbeyliensis TaxID=1128664 RepID=A0A542DQP3_AMYCI|nr:hypothetical protein FB471_5261 [Amycolatopsis cihanbeyliensis]
MSWQQPCPDGVLRTVEVPCTRDCGGHWQHPHAEGDRVIDQPDDRPTRVRGHADEAQEIGGDFIRAALDHGGFLRPR